MKVYVVIAGCYETTWPVGVYASPEAAMAAHTPKEVAADHVPTAANCSRPGGWQKTDAEPPEWLNGLDWDDAAQIVEFEVEGLTEASESLDG